MRCVLLLSVILCLGAPGAQAQGMVVSLTPPDTVVTPGTQFELQFRVTESGPEFNAYDAVIGYDPGALTFLPQSPLSLQEGSLMKSACGQTFHLFSAQGDSLNISHSLLCGTPPVFLTGPGQLYKLRFQASAELQVTTVTLRYVQFFRAGIFVDLDSATDATIHIGDPSSDVLPTAGSQLRLRATPNPFNPNTQLHLSSPASGYQVVTVWDARGRLVRNLQRGYFGAGTRTLHWDARAATGEALASGVYLVSLDVNGQRTTTRVVLTK